MDKTPWFNAKKQTPVHDGEYEVRCNSANGWSDPKMWTRGEILGCACHRCEWRGLTKPAKERA